MRPLVSTWEQRKLGEIFEEYSEKNRADLPPLTIIQGGGTVYRDESNRNLQFDKNSLSNYKAVNPDDFIVHLRSFEGGLEKATCCGLISPAYHTFHGDGIDSDFYYLYFRSKRFIDTDLKPHVYGIRDGRSIDIDGMKTIPIPWTTVNEQRAIGGFYNSLDFLITLHQRKCQYCGLYGYLSWEQRKLGDELERIQERNRKGFGGDRWISVSRMYFQNPDKVQSNNLDTRTYVMRHGDMAFEGHKNSEHEYGRLVVNDIGDGIISELFPIYRHKCDFDNQFWKYAVMPETIWRPIFARSIAASGNSSNKLIDEHMFSESVFVPCVEEQRAIGALLHQIDRTITLHQ